MKTRLRLLYYSFVLLLISGSAFSQISYTSNFNNETNVDTWDNDEFYFMDELPCQGAGAMAANLYSFSPYAASFSPAIGTSNGGLVTFNYRYKIVDYDDPTVAIQNSDEWGFIEVYWSTNPDGDYTLLQTIDPSNHIESGACAQKSVTFQPPAGATVYLAIYTETTNEDLDYWVYFDQVQVTQAAPTACSGTPALAATVSSRAALCNGQSATLSLSPGYVDTGLTIQWQSSPDNVTYTNVPTGGTGVTYTTTQAASTWYRAVVTCTASAQSVNTTPVRVVSTGIPCPCAIEFVEGVEPITRVNFAGINNTSSAGIDGSPALQDFTNVAPGQVTAGQSYPIALEGNTNDDFEFGEYENYFTVFIDWNHDGDFADTNETYEIDGFLIFSNGTDSQQVTGPIAVPANALAGYTYMRVVKNWYDDSADWNQEYGGACGDQNSGFGQAEDYLLNVTVPSVETPDWVNLQHPGTITIAQGGSDTVYAQVWEGGLTEAAGAGAGITAWIGISPVGSNTNPNTWTTWVPATFNAQSGNNDEYMAVIGANLAPGTYYYASRFQLNGGTYVYGGYEAPPSGGGIWNGTTNVSGVLTVTCATAAPTANATQTFCAGATVANLQATGSVITWYGSATGGTALAPTTALTNGTVYYAAITPAGGCESLTRTPVTVTLTTTPAPTANAAQSFCPGATVADLEAEGTTISWYAAATGGTALTGTTTLVNGTTYHASITPQDGCESIARTPVTATILVTAAPAAAAEQTFCQGATIADLDAEGDAITWYSAATGGTILATTTVLTDGTIYYASATPTGGCESVARTAVTAEITTTAAPTVEESTQTFCNEAEINDLDADGGGEILWYAAEAGGMPLNEDSEVTSGTTYYAAQVIDGCESVGRTAVTAEITTTDMPEGDQMQDVEAGTADEATIADLELTATGTVTWYATAEDAEEGENPLGTDTQLVTGTTYYATQTIDGCESLGFAVTVTVTLGNGEFNTTAFRYYPNPVKDVLTVSYDRNIAAIEVYNIVGQQVIAKTVNLNEATVDLSQLSAGTYLVKVMGDSASKTIKIVKQ